ncbi:MAG: shikimate dehydrogenase [Rhodothermia bacterium]|nr:MAG: shikimate dehydrogenase [Rhodothermia bacterium]
MSVTPDTRIVALLGDPVTHSLSPFIHNTGFEELNLDMVYLAFRVEKASLGDAINGIKTFRFQGANVTIPHKQDVIFFLDELTERAEAVGAVNTITCDYSGSASEPRLIGDNTDVSGFARPLGEFKEKLKDQEALVWGSGGAARAVTYAMLNELDLARIHLVCRSVESGEALVRLIDPSGNRIEVVKWDYAALSMQQATLLVNTTPLGMTPDIDATPCLQPELIHDGHIVYDLVYNPSRTLLLNQASIVGASAVGGVEMLLGQAAESFKAWTGAELPEERVRAAIQTKSQSNS